MIASDLKASETTRHTLDALYRRVCDSVEEAITAIAELDAGRANNVINMKGEAVDGALAPSSEKGFHLGLYLKRRDVNAVVIDGDSPRFVLLGMNVLGQFEIDQRENLLILRSKF